MIEWHPPVDISHDSSPIFVRITKSVGARPIYSYHFLRTLNNGSASKHLPVNYDAKTLKIKSDEDVILQLKSDAKAWIEKDLQENAAR